MAGIIEIEVNTHYLSAQSSPESEQYVFSYTITITNTTSQQIQLLAREWRITDAENKITRVAGDGVVGQQPVLQAGESFSYTSGTVLATPIGTMEGHYVMIDENGEQFKADIPSFRLAIPNIIH